MIISTVMVFFVLLLSPPRSLRSTGKHSQPTKTSGTNEQTLKMYHTPLLPLATEKKEKENNKLRKTRNTRTYATKHSTASGAT